MAKLITSRTGIRWVVGETLVIVIGVLIALGLDDYWTERQEKSLEIEYLNRIQSDLRSDIAFVELWNERLATKLDAIEAIAPVVRGRVPPPEDLESFLVNVSLGGIMGAASGDYTARTTYEDLQSTGNMRLIRDANLRRDIALYHLLAKTRPIRYAGRQTDYVKTVHSIIPAELREEIDANSLNEFGIGRAMERILSPEFESILNQEINYAYFLRGQDVRTPIDALLTEIETYLAKQ